MDPLHQFVIRPILSFSVCGCDLSFTNASLAILTSVTFVYVFFFLGLRRPGIVPNRMQALVEISYNLVAGMISDTSGPQGIKYFPFVFSIFFLVLFGNLVGLLPYSFTFTSHIIATFTIAMIVFVMVTVLGFILHGFKFFGVFAPAGLPSWLLPFVVPIEMISYLARPLSLAIRLFANMLAGHAMMKIFAAFAGSLASLGVAGSWAGIFTPIPILGDTILMGLEFVIALIQAYIFSILTCIYLNDSIHLHGGE